MTTFKLGRKVSVPVDTGNMRMTPEFPKGTSVFGFLKGLAWMCEAVVVKYKPNQIINHWRYPDEEPPHDCQRVLIWQNMITVNDVEETNVHEAIWLEGAGTFEVTPDLWFAPEEVHAWMPKPEAPAIRAVTEEIDDAKSE